MKLLLFALLLLASTELKSDDFGISYDITNVVASYSYMKNDKVLKSFAKSFNSGSGNVLKYRIQYEYEYNQSFSFCVGIGLERQFFEFLKEDSRKYRKYDTLIDAKFKLSCSGYANYLSIPFSAVYYPSNYFRFELGIEPLVYIKSDLEVHDRILSPSYLVFTENKKKLMKLFSGEIPEAKSIMLNTSLSVASILPLHSDKDIYALPKISYNLNFDKLVGDDYSYHGLGFSLGIIYKF